MAIVAVKISDVNDGNREDAIRFIQDNLLMPLPSIKLALTIPGFNFYSDKFKDVDWNSFVAPFTVTTVNIDSSFYINILGRKLEVPVSRTNDVFNYETLLTGDFILKTSINLLDSEVKALINSYVKDRLLLDVFISEGGEFNEDFNIDFNI